MFVVELRAIASTCNFGDILETMLCNQIMCGINDRVIQKRLFAEVNLTFHSAIEIAQSHETAVRNAR